MPNTKPLDPAEIDELFIKVNAPAPNTFELALVLGGTVSSGAYTAGVLDFLFEALDAWSDAKAKGDKMAPKHNVLLRFMTGASGGSVNAAIAARALAYDFPHISRGTPDPGAKNPFYEIWVNQLDLSSMLDTTDLAKGGPARALLDGKCIDDAAAYVASYPDPALGIQRKDRPYLDDPLRVIPTVTNLRGVSYNTDLGRDGGGVTREPFVNHADYGRFAVRYPWQTFANPRPDEWTLCFGQEKLANAAQWSDFSEFAKASGAFPVGLPPRELVRPLEHYRYRVSVLPGDGKTHDEVVALVPDWAAITPADGSEDYRFTSVDGGVTDNEPIQLARTALSGILGRNPRDGMLATRGVLLIDPFGGDAAPGQAPDPAKPAGLFGLAATAINSMVQQQRYDSRDLVLALAPEVYSRFMIRAARGSLTGNMALATAGLGAFLGFASAAFRRHDYLLGRFNCQQYLKNTFVLPVGSKVFADGMWTQAQVKAYGVSDNNTTMLPLIPLMGSASTPETLDPWPAGKLDPRDFRDAIEGRFKAVIGNIGPDFLGGVVTWFVEHLGEGKVADFAIHEIDDTLTQWNLK